MATTIPYIMIFIRNAVTNIFKLRVLIIISVIMPQVICAKSNIEFDKLLQECSHLSSRELFDTGVSYYKQGKFEKAYPIFQIVYNREKPDDTDEEKRLYASAHLYGDRISYKKNFLLNAVYELSEAYRLSTELNDKVLLSTTYNNIGVVYGMYDDYHQASFYYEQAWKTGRNCQDKDKLFQMLNNAISAYLYVPNIKKAVALYDEMKKERPSASSKYIKLYDYCLKLLGGTISSMKNGHTAGIDQMKEALVIADKIADKKELLECSALQEIYAAYNRAGIKDSSFLYLMKYYDVASKANIVHKRINALKNMERMFLESGNTGKALKYKQMYLNLQDSAMSIKMYSQMSSMLFKMEHTRSQQEIKDRESLVEKQKSTIKMISAALLVLAVLFVITLIVRYRTLKRNKMFFMLNKEVVEQQEMLTQRTGQKVDIPANCAKDEKDKQKQVQEDKPKYKHSGLSNEIKDELLRKIDEVMSKPETFCAKDFTLQKLSSMINSNTAYVSQVINESKGKSFNVYVNEKRVGEARKRLTIDPEYSKFTISAISESVGFRSLSSFNSAFKNLTGMTPSIYKQMAANK